MKMGSPCRWMKIHKKMDRYPDMNHSLLRDILQPGLLLDGRKQVSRKLCLGTQIAGLEMHLAPARANYIGNHGLWGRHPNSSCDSVVFCYAFGNFGGVGGCPNNI